MIFTLEKKQERDENVPERIFQGKMATRSRNHLHERKVITKVELQYCFHYDSPYSKMLLEAFM